MKLPLPRLELRTLFFVIFSLAIFAAIFIRDPDFFFHVKAGQDILQNHAIPEVDHYSFTHEGGPWRAHEWLFEIFIYLLFTYGGYLGIKLFVAAMAIGAVVVSATALSERRNSELPLVMLSALLLAPFLTPRPHLFTLLFFAVYLFALLRFKYRGELRHLWGLPLLMVVWVNVHGGFLLGIFIVATFLGSELLSARWQQRLTTSWPQLRPLALTLLGVSLASLLNPWGIHQWLFPFELLGSGAMAEITEWQPLNFAELHARGYLAALGLLLLLYLYTPRRPDTTEVVVPWGMVTASFLSVRHMALALLAMVPFMVLMQQRLFASAAWRDQPWVAAVRRRLSGGKQLGHSEYLLNAILLSVVVALFALLYPYYHRNDEAKLNELVPERATNFILASNLQGRMFNTYHYGGYLIFRLAPQRRVFIDIRGDMYGGKMMNEYQTVYYTLTGWQKLLEHYAIDYIVVEQSAPLVEGALESGRFATAYRDSESVVLVRNDARYQPLIEAWRSSHPDEARQASE